MERWIIKAKVPVPSWRLRPGDSIIVDVVSKDFEAGTLTFRSIYDGREATLRSDGFEFERLAKGKAALTDPPVQDKLL